ncbi:MAG: tetratricopeptide repeat protein [Myxococcota bacterium]
MNTRPRWGRMAAIALLLALPTGCREDAGEEPTKSRPAQARAVDEGTPKPAEEPSKVHEETGKVPPAQGRMPNDSVHAGLRDQRPGNQRPGMDQQELPEGHPPLAEGDDTVVRTQAPSVEEGEELPLLRKGAGSSSELEERLAPVEDDEVKGSLEKAFRLVFTISRPNRDPAKAKALLEGLPREGEVGATVERILAYVAVSQGFDAKAALKHYKRAVELDSDYGEAHYALSFMHVMDDREAGKEHYDIARRLGVPDNSNLARYYGEDADAEAPVKGHGGAPAEGGEEGGTGAH